MKIAILGTRGIPSRYSGIETATYEIATRLVQNGHTVVVYCRDHSNTDSNSLPENIKRVFIPTINTKHLGTFIHTLLSTLHVVFSNAQVVHFHALGPSLFSFLPRIFGKKTVVTVHGLDWKRKKWKYPARLFLKLCEYAAVFFPHKTIVISLSLKEYFEKKFKKQTFLIPNGITVRKPDFQSDSNVSRLSYILYVGRLVPEKGIHYLICAFNDIKSNKRLVLVGEPSFTEGYAQYLHSLSKGNIEFTGFVQGRRLEELYKNAYLFVLPSDVEGSPVALLEAMGHANCVLVSNIPESLEIVGDSGFSFEAGNPLDLKAKLQLLLDNPDIVAQARQKAFHRVSNRYNWDYIIREIEHLYLSLQG